MVWRSIFLHHREYTWVQDPLEYDAQIGVETKTEGRVEKERLPRCRRVHQVHAADQRTTIEEWFITAVTDWNRLTRHVARLRRILQPKADRSTSTAITAEKLKNAQLALFFLCQTEFREDLDKCRSTFVKLAPVCDAKGMNDATASCLFNLRYATRSFFLKTIHW